MGNIWIQKVRVIVPQEKQNPTYNTQIVNTPAISIFIHLYVRLFCFVFVLINIRTGKRPHGPFCRLQKGGENYLNIFFFFVFLTQRKQNHKT